jgi:CRISPR/Cas system-associated exonuclease Cas4 (RecB family)
MSVNDLPDIVKSRLLDDDQARHFKHEATERDERLSLTELLYCPRKAYWNRKGWVQMPVSALWRMKMGSLLDDWYTSLFARRQQRVTYTVYVPKQKYETSPTVTVSGIFDLEHDGAIADLKFMRSLEPTRNNGPGQYYIEQVVFYCYCESVQIGKIHAAAHGDFEIVDVPIDTLTVEEVMTSLEDRAVALYKALVMEGPGSLDGPMYRWECDGCQYSVRCAEVDATKDEQAVMATEQKTEAK